MESQVFPRLLDNTNVNRFYHIYCCRSQDPLSSQSAALSIGLYYLVKKKLNAEGIYLSNSEA